MKTQLSTRSKAKSSKRAFTLIELLAVITIIAILASVLFVVGKGVRRKAEQVQCGNNLKTLHIALGAYLQDNKRWPQVAAGDDEEAYWQTWADVLEPYELPDKVWMCPSHMRATKDEFLRYSSYHPMPFDGKSAMTPYRWSNMPWVMEIGDNHGDGPLMIMPDGSIQAGVNIEKPLETLKGRE
ncbi:MAG: prepilin-type N-terminal cleavage/methylation domain-containing protein [Verrucomicrobiales bacterium]|jgi:prepilin-type N-terminal cleavage/methylation domain-containing protein